MSSPTHTYCKFGQLEKFAPPNPGGAGGGGGMLKFIAPFFNKRKVRLGLNPVYKINRLLNKQNNYLFFYTIKLYINIVEYYTNFK